MLSGSNTTAHDRRRVTQRQPKRVAELMESLRLVVTQREVCYEIRQIWSTSEGVKRQEGFELTLCGVNAHAVLEGRAEHSVTGCQSCARIHSDLREVAEWVVQLNTAPGGYKVYPFDYMLHLAPPSRQHRSEIISTTAIFYRFDDQPKDYRTESECMKEVRQRLSKLGVRKDVWLAQRLTTPGEKH